jgi:hypothetical protein
MLMAPRCVPLALDTSIETSLFQRAAFLKKL